MSTPNRIRIDIWASLRSTIESEMNRTGLSANEVVNIALANYFDLSPKGNKINEKSVPQIIETVPSSTTASIPTTDSEDYI